MEVDYIERIQEQYMFEWLKRAKRKPLVIRGARQVGKSTLVEHFAKKAGLTLVNINLEEHSSKIAKEFIEGDFEKIIAKLNYITGNKIEEQSDKKILFLDEIQAIPQALQSLRYFYEKLPLLPVVAAGSVLEFVLSDETYSMPVGRVEFLHIPPLTFKEFLRKRGKGNLIAEIESLSIIKDKHEKIISLNSHTELMRLMREFFLTGGMPEVVAVDDDLTYVSQAIIQRDILASYRNDIQKYPSTKHIRSIIAEVFDRAAGVLGQKLKYSRIAPEKNSRDTKKALSLLLEAGILSEVVHTHCNGIPLLAEKKDEIRKIYFLDIGLLCSAMGLKREDIALPDALSFINEGVLAEQFIAQELMATFSLGEKTKMFYWLREGALNNAEVDFVLSIGKQIIPVEVKSGTFGVMRSLKEYCKAKNPKFAVRFDANPASMQQLVGWNATESLTLISLPLYMVSELKRIIHSFE